MESVWPYLWALAPTIGVGFLFYHIIKYILEGDRRERLAQAQWEAQRTAESTKPAETPQSDTTNS